MSAEQCERLAEGRDRLAADTAAFLKELDETHQAMAEELHQRLADDRDRLASDVAEMRSELQADQSEARQVWSNFTTLMQQRRAGKPMAPPPPPPIEKAPPPLPFSLLSLRKLTQP